MNTELDIKDAKVISMLTEDLVGTTRRMRMIHGLWESGCLTSNEDHGPVSREYAMPHLPVDRRRVYTGTREAGSYNHHSQLAKFKGRYYFGFSNGIIDEDVAGQRTLVAGSDDGINWSEAECVVPADADKGEIRMCLGLYAGEDELVMYNHRCWRDEAEAQAATMGSVTLSRLDTVVTRDGRNWEVANEGIVEEDGRAGVLFEAPHMTREGILLAGGAIKQPVALRWDAGNPAGKPEVIKMPSVAGAGTFPYGEAAWYQTDDGTIVMFWRDEAQSLRLYVNCSRDGGKTWTPPLLSDIPDSMSRVSAGRLPDGRYFLAGNTYARLLDRMHLMLSISEDGYKFDKMYTLLDDPTAQRTKGLLKCHGYQYPIVMVDGDRLLIGYSVNKEDIECGIVKIADL